MEGRLVALRSQYSYNFLLTNAPEYFIGCLFSYSDYEQRAIILGQGSRKIDVYKNEKKIVSLFP